MTTPGGSVVFNALAWGFEHVPFDAALIASLAEAYPGEPVHFFGETEHLRLIQRFLAPRFPNADVVWHELTLPPRLATPRERIGDDLRTTRAMLSEARRLDAGRVIAAYMHSTTGIVALKALAQLYRPRSLAFIHHGSLLRLVSSRRYHPLLWLGNGRLRQIVLGDSIRDEVLGQLPVLRGSLHAIRHPYFFDDAETSDLPVSGPTGFSFLGLVDENKGFPEFVDLASTLAPAWKDAAYFDLIGGTRVGALPNTHGPWVKTYLTDGPMPRDVYEAQLRKTHYAVFPYNPSYYKFIASGSVLDALTAGKPIIALRNSQFDEMFKTMGDIGYLCDDVRQMKELAAGILRDPPRERYRRQSQNILTGRSVFGTAAVAQQLRGVLDGPS
jgi:hypothetical protein